MEGQQGSRKRGVPTRKQTQGPLKKRTKWSQFAAKPEPRRGRKGGSDEDLPDLPGLGTSCQRFPSVKAKPKDKNPEQRNLSARVGAFLGRPDVRQLMGWPSGFPGKQAIVFYVEKIRAGECSICNQPFVENRSCLDLVKPYLCLNNARGGYDLCFACVLCKVGLRDVKVEGMPAIQRAGGSAVQTPKPYIDRCEKIVRTLGFAVPELPDQWDQGPSSSDLFRLTPSEIKSHVRNNPPLLPEPVLVGNSDDSTNDEFFQLLPSFPCSFCKSKFDPKNEVMTRSYPYYTRRRIAETVEDYVELYETDWTAMPVCAHCCHLMLDKRGDVVQLMTLYEFVPHIMRVALFCADRALRLSAPPDGRLYVDNGFVRWFPNPDPEKACCEVEQHWCAVDSADWTPEVDEDRQYKMVNEAHPYFACPRLGPEEVRRIRSAWRGRTGTHTDPGGRNHVANVLAGAGLNFVEDTECATLFCNSGAHYYGPVLLRPANTFPKDHNISVDDIEVPHALPDSFPDLDNARAVFHQKMLSAFTKQGIPLVYHRLCEMGVFFHKTDAH
jgi:hypothetical protein